MRKRQIEVTATGLKPELVSIHFLMEEEWRVYCSPKLVEIEMQEGVFEVGETVEGEIEFGEKVDFGSF